jgi:Arc/MetJ family transcription regulator
VVRRLTRGKCASPLGRRCATLLGVASTEGLGFRVPATVLPCVSNVTKVHSMRTNIEIDDKLMKDALRATGAKTKKEAVELGLRTLLDLRAQEKARELRGKITWEGDLNAMRTDR